jgi:hypothetical protein
MKPSFPVAARIPAEPGWNFVVLRKTGVRDSETSEQVELRCYPVTTWGVPAPQMMRAPASLPSTPSFNTTPHLWPLDDEGRFVDEDTLAGAGVYGPDKSPDEALAAAKADLDAEVARWERVRAKPAPP